MEIQARGNRKKRAFAITAVVCALALLLTGTFAYYNMVNAVNEFKGENDNEVVLHDDYFEEGEENADGEMEYDKDIYVENLGSTELYIRVRLEEFLSLDEHVTLPNGAQYNEQETERDKKYVGWHPHNYASAETCEDCGTSFHNYYVWEMGNTGKQIYKKADINEPGEITDGVAYRYESTTDADKNTTSDDKWLDASEPDPIPTPGGSYDTDVWGEIQAETEVISMEEYWARVKIYEDDPLEAAGIDQEEWKGWILDNDGWAYWSQKLAGEEVTGLLLSKVTMIQQPPGEAYFYGIVAELDAVDELDVGSWLTNEQSLMGSDKVPEVATEKAQELLKSLGAYIRTTGEE